VLRISAGEFTFVARLEDEEAPKTVAAFRRLLPLDSQVIHVRWSGESMWIPFGELDVRVGFENATSTRIQASSSSTPAESARPSSFSVRPPLPPRRGPAGG
jgi:Protein of unknown function (DUF3830)